MRTDRRRSTAITVAALVLISGCTTPPTGAPPTPESRRGPTPAAAVSALGASFAELAGTIPATVGIAVAPVGGATVSALGSWSTGVAWSTIKVPLAIAAQRADPASAPESVTKAITESDNAAAEQLWSTLGSPDRAAQQVQAVLADGDDAATMVESRRLRPGFTAFGQTQWSLQRQARFAAHLPCIADAAAVLDLMHHLVASQRWGLAADRTAAAKGGWGPGRAGGYLVRQFGIVSTAAGEVGVALAAEPHDGTFATGVAALDQLAGWLSAHAPELPAGTC
jgi:hypothetical protein